MKSEKQLQAELAELEALKRMSAKNGDSLTVQALIQADIAMLSGVLEIAPNAPAIAHGAHAEPSWALNIQHHC